MLKKKLEISQLMKLEAEGKYNCYERGCRQNSGKCLKLINLWISLSSIRSFHKSAHFTCPCLRLCYACLFKLTLSSSLSNILQNYVKRIQIGSIYVTICSTNFEKTKTLLKMLEISNQFMAQM